MENKKLTGNEIVIKKKGKRLHKVIVNGVELGWVKSCNINSVLEPTKIQTEVTVTLGLVKSLRIEEAEADIEALNIDLKNVEDYEKLKKIIKEAL